MAYSWSQVMTLSLTLKSVCGEGKGVRAKIVRGNIFCLITPYFALRSWPVIISKFKYVHHGHFGTLQRFLGFSVKFWEVDGLSKYVKLWHKFAKNLPWHPGDLKMVAK